MAYWDDTDLPFYYSLANTFCLANRWFCSAPCQTYPNRRFLLAGTAFGLISTDTSSITQNPPNGTIFDRLNAHSISWRDYFTDVPGDRRDRVGPAEQSCRILLRSTSSTLTARRATCQPVSFVDSDIGVAPVAAGAIARTVQRHRWTALEQNQDEENGDLSLGENFVSGVVNAVLRSPVLAANPARVAIRRAWWLV